MAALVKRLPVYLIHWNAPSWLIKSVQSVLNSDIEIELYVVDNGPAAATQSLELPASVRLIAAGENRGYTGGANIGIRHWLSGESSWCIIGAHDLQVGVSDIGGMLAAAERTKGFGIIGPGTDDYFAGERIGMSEGIEERSAMSGTCLLLRRECIEQIGLFDEEFGSYAEDKEICFRAWQHGWKVGRVLGTTAHGLGTKVTNRSELLHRNNVLLARKTSGRLAAARLIASHGRVLVASAAGSPRSGQAGASSRSEARYRLRVVRAVLPLLWRQMLPPPAASSDLDG